MTTDVATSALIFEPIPSGELEKIRATGMDEAGNRLVPQVDAEGGSPLRCCLRETRPGEQVLLFAYTPPGTSGPYAERGPVFVHPAPCGGYPTPHQYPPELIHRPQVVRAYDHQGRIADGILADNGDHALAVVRQMLARQGIALVHLRNVGYGCYNCLVRRGREVSSVGVRVSGHVRFEPREHGVKRVGEFAELIVTALQLDPVGE